MIKVHISLSNGETVIYSFALTEGMQLSIGRDASCDISLPSESYMSRVHCIISYTNGQLVIQDNQSANGIFLGNQRIVSDFLVMGQAYRFGSCTMVVSEAEVAGAGQTPYEPSSAPYAQQPAYPQAYPQPTAYPQPNAAPQPEAYPQAYPQPTAYPQPEPAPQPEAYPQAYPQPTAYPQPEPAPQPEAYPQPDALPPQQPVIQAPVSPSPDALPQSQSGSRPDTSAPEEPPTEPAVGVEDMLVSELTQDVDRKEENESMWGRLISQGKRKLGEWTSGLKKNRKPAPPDVTDNPIPPAAQTESDADHASSPDARSVPTASPHVEEVPDKPAAVGVDDGKVVVRKRGRHSAAPEAQVVGLPGSVLGLPVDFELRFRVTSPSPRFEQDSLLRFCVRTKQDCRVYMVSHSCDGDAEIIIPGEKNTDNLVFTSVEAKFPGVGHEEYNMVVEPPFGAECVVLIAVGTTAKCDFIKELREKIRQKNADLSPGVPEKEAIRAFISEHPKQKDIPWSGAVLNFTTVPKQQ